MSSWLTNKTSIQQLKLQLDHEDQVVKTGKRRERLEELYLLLTHWNNYVFSDYLDLTLVMNGHMDYNGYLDRVVERGNENKFDFNRIVMILDIYGVEFKQSYFDVLSVRGEWNDLVEMHKEAYKSGDTVATHYLNDAGRIQLKLEGTIDKLKVLIAESIDNSSKTSL